MAWLQVHQTLKDHRKLFDAADQLEVEPPHMMGLLVSFWLWALDNAPTGSLVDITPRMISRAAQWDGDPEKLAKTLIRAGWIDEKEDGTLEIHDWYEYAGKLIDQRQAEKERSRSRRAAAAASADASPDDPTPTAGRPANSRKKAGGRVDQSREDKTREGNTPPSPSDEGSDGGTKSLVEARFLEFWKAYPKKTGKQYALKAWNKIKPTAELHERIMQAVDAQKRSDQWRRENGRYIPNPSTWLNGGYLDAFDHWLRDDRGLVYGRYMDDFYIIHSDKLLLRQILKEIEAYIKPLGLRLNGKTQILPLKNGIDFLGFHTYLTQTGKVVRKVRAKSIDNMKRKIRKFRGLVDSGKMTLDSVVQSYASWTGHISHGNTYHLRQNMDAYFFSYFPELKPSPKGDTTHGPKTEQPRKQVEGQVRQPIRQPDRLDRGR